MLGEVKNEWISKNDEVLESEVSGFKDGVSFLCSIEVGGRPLGG